MMHRVPLELFSLLMTTDRKDSHQDDKLGNILTPSAFDFSRMGGTPNRVNLGIRLTPPLGLST
jgi:hypothetical protein